MKIILSIIILLCAILCLYFVLSKREKFVEFVSCTTSEECISALGPGHECIDEEYCNEINTTSVSNLDSDNQMSSILSKLQLQKIKLNSLRRRVNQSD